MSRRYEFGSFLLDTHRRILYRDQVPVPLTAKAFSLLEVLAERHGTTVDKQTLLDTVWSGSVVEENTLTRTVSMVRKALGESPGQHEYIVTEPGRGYRFVGALRPEATELAPPGSSQPSDNSFSSRRFVRSAVAVLAILGLAGLITDFTFRHSLIQFPDWIPSRLITHGRVVKAAISPDGGAVAYVSGVRGHEGVSLYQIGDATSRTLIAEEAAHYLGLTFAPRGPLLYLVGTRSQLPPALWRVDTQTGERLAVLEDLDSPITFSPDGARFAFIRSSHSTLETTLMIADSTGHLQKLAARELPEWLDYPAWSPDGTIIACTLVDRTRGAVRIVAADLKSGRIRPLASRSWGYIVQLAWVDQRSIVFSARDPSKTVYRLWQLSIDSGEARPITDQLTYLEGSSATADGNSVISVQEQVLSAVWIVRSETDRRQITGDSSAHANAIWLTDMSILLEQTDDAERANLWSMNLDGTGRRQLTTGKANFNASVCPNGDVVLVSDRDGALGIWRMRPEGEDWAKVVPDTGTTVPKCSQDGKWVVYSTVAGGPWLSAWKTPLDGGHPLRLNPGYCDHASPSPDGRFVACLMSSLDSVTGGGSISLAIIPFAGGDPAMLFPLGQSVQYHPGLHWSSDSGSVFYIDKRNGVARIWRQSLSGGPAQPLEVVAAAEIFHFQPGPKGEWIISTARKSSDVVLLRR